MCLPPSGWLLNEALVGRAPGRRRGSKQASNRSHEDCPSRLLTTHLAAFPATSDPEYVFTNDAGEPVRRQTFAQLWVRKVDASSVERPIRFHDLRHFYASLLIRHGESVKTVQARLGHASATETLDTYAHLWPDSEDRTRRAGRTVEWTTAAPRTHDGRGLSSTPVTRSNVLA